MYPQNNNKRKKKERKEGRKEGRKKISLVTLQTKKREVIISESSTLVH
jgi:hypothetical protein